MIKNMKDHFRLLFSSEGGLQLAILDGREVLIPPSHNSAGLDPAVELSQGQTSLLITVRLNLHLAFSLCLLFLPG